MSNSGVVHTNYDMTAVGFEPTQLALVELESTPLDHLGKLSCSIRFLFYAHVLFLLVVLLYDVNLGLGVPSGHAPRISNPTLESLGHVGLFLEAARVRRQVFVSRFSWKLRALTTSSCGGRRARRQSQ